MSVVLSSHELYRGCAVSTRFMQETVICQPTSVKAFFYTVLPSAEQSAHRRLFPAPSHLSSLHEWERQTADRATSSQEVTDTRFRNSGWRRAFRCSKLSSVTTTHPLHVLSDIILLIIFHNPEIHNNYNNSSIFYVYFNAMWMWTWA